jgi:3-hydroxyisobutyrate dehydrogenase-like beta-hydroxyacid dehydrogenase
MQTLGILHPGAMGSSVGAAARQNGARVLWCSSGRSPETERRANADGLCAVPRLEELVCAADTIVSVCPPDAALELAQRVAEQGFRGLYVDANAVSRQTARAIAERIERAGASFVDGGILGPPARAGSTTLLCLSGARAPDVAALFRGSLLEPNVIGAEPGQASALKMAFAAWTKGSTALLCAVRALAEVEGVGAALLASWARLSPELELRSEQAALGAASKAWRWVGEMNEIAASFAAARLPSGFHEAAADIYARLAPFKSEPASMSALLAALAAQLETPERKH